MTKTYVAKKTFWLKGVRYEVGDELELAPKAARWMIGQGKIEPKAVAPKKTATKAEKKVAECE